MVSIFTLWLPVLMSAILVFVVSAVIHMMLRYHADDHRALPDENGVLEALSKFSIPPGDYALPKAGSMEAMRDPAFQAKLAKGPVFMGTFLKPGPFDMGPSLIKWFVYCVVMSVLSAYVAGRVLAPGTHYLTVFRVVGTVAFMGYSLAHWQDTIWYQRSLNTTLKNTFDGLVYALFTAGTFGWLWPK